MREPTPDLATTVLTRLGTAYGAARDPGRAVAMSAYMRDRFPFLGIAAPAQRQLSREVLAGLSRPDESALRSVALGCWALPEREYQYFACGYLRRHAVVCGPGFLATARTLVTVKPWWDTVDVLAAHLVGPLVRRHPELVAELDSWIVDADLWLVRTALLHQLAAKEDTDERRLFGYCVRQAGHPDFFVRKAIGWALREYAKTEPVRVRHFVTANRSRLAPMSVREALKNVG
ncbi:DNA alkylation repair protein [Plantactinospora sp. GCM10030261]|uniref:DNA alkylation repair protein n=1 Tax=Plantactinospora sp. GCM10030261 TaxID=3273420 RepID=UPI003617A971